MPPDKGCRGKNDIVSLQRQNKIKSPADFRCATEVQRTDGFGTALASFFVLD